MIIKYSNVTADTVNDINELDKNSKPSWVKSEDVKSEESDVKDDEVKE